VETKHLKPGTIQKTINVETNDESKKFITLTLKANIYTVLDINPENVSIYTFKGEEGRFAISLKSQKYFDFKIKKIEIDNPKIKYTLDKPEDENAMKEKGYALTIIAPPDFPVGNYNGKIKIETNIKEMPEEEINYVINVQDLITVNPPNINLNVSKNIYKIISLEDIPVYENNFVESPVIGTLTQNKEAYVISSDEKFAQIRFESNKNGYVLLEKTKKIYSGSSINISIQKHKGENFEVKKVECDLPFIKVETKQVQPNYYIVTLTYEGEMSKNNYKGKIIIYTNDNEKPRIERDIFVNVGYENPTIAQPPRNIPINRKIDIKNPPQRLEEKK